MNVFEQRRVPALEARPVHLVARATRCKRARCRLNKDSGIEPVAGAAISVEVLLDARAACDIPQLGSCAWTDTGEVVACAYLHRDARLRLSNTRDLPVSERAANQPVTGI